MSKLVPIIAGVTGTAALATGGSYWLLTQNTKEETKVEKISIRNKFQHALIDLTGKGDDLLKEKLKKLKGSNTNPSNAKLRSAKTKRDGETDNGLDELKQACKEIYDSDFIEGNSNISSDFKDYCARNVKDQITGAKWALDDTGFQWNNKHTALKNPASGITLVPKLTEIASKDSIDNEALKRWCKEVEDSIFEGEQDNTYKNANEFCTKP